jgi:hypothetical protein
VSGGLLVAAAVFLAFLAWARLTGLWERPNIGAQMWFELLQAVMIGYALAACAISLRGALRDFDDLRETLELSPVEFESERQALTSFRPGPLVAAALIGFGVGVALLFYPPSWEGGVRPEFGDPIFMWLLVRNGLMLGLYGCTVYIEVEVALRLSRIGERVARVDRLSWGQVTAPPRRWPRRGRRRRPRRRAWPLQR